jgi:serine/threonine-protein kinase PknG
MECTGDPAASERLYDRVWRVDRGYLSAAFALARLRLAADDRDGALAVLDQVPNSSSLHTAAQVAAVRASLRAGAQPIKSGDLLHASSRLERLTLDVERQARLAVEMLEAALAWITSTRLPEHRIPPAARVLGHTLTERGLRFGLEKAYRAMAQLAHDSDSRIALVDRANAVRPRTLV